MANKNKKPNTPPAAKSNKPIHVLDLTQAEEMLKSSPVQSGLDPNHQMDLMNLLDKKFGGPDKKATAARYSISEEQVESVDKMIAIGAIAILANEVTFAQNPFAIRMRQHQLEAIKELGTSMGISFNTKLLPETTENSEEVVEVSSEAVEVTEETKEQIKKENEIASNTPNLDVKTMTSVEELYAAINYILVSKEYNNFNKFIVAADTYRSYMEEHGTDEEKQKVAGMNMFDLLKEVKDIAKTCPFVASGLGKFMLTLTHTYHNPAMAFIQFRNASKDKETRTPALDDSEFVDIVRLLIIWASEAQQDFVNSRIEAAEKTIETLSKDTKANAKAIEQQKGNIEVMRNQITYHKEAIEYATNPSTQFADEFIDACGNKEHPSHNNAIRLRGMVLQSYYEDLMGDIKEGKYNEAIIRKNIQQRLGIIINMFRPAGTANQNYNVTNIIPMEQVEIKAEEAPKENPEETKKA